MLNQLIHHHQQIYEALKNQSPAVITATPPSILQSHQLIHYENELVRGAAAKRKLSFGDALGRTNYYSARANQADIQNLNLSLLGKINKLTNEREKHKMTVLCSFESTQKENRQRYSHDHSLEVGSSIQTQKFLIAQKQPGIKKISPLTQRINRINLLSAQQKTQIAKKKKKVDHSNASPSTLSQKKTKPIRQQFLANYEIQSGVVQQQNLIKKSTQYLQVLSGVEDSSRDRNQKNGKKQFSHRKSDRTKDKFISNIMRKEKSKFKNSAAKNHRKLQLQTEEEWLRKIKRRLELSEITFVDSFFKNTSHEIAHLNNIYAKERSERKDLIIKICLGAEEKKKRKSKITI